MDNALLLCPGWRTSLDLVAPPSLTVQPAPDPVTDREPAYSGCVADLCLACGWCVRLDSPSCPLRPLAIPTSS
ncbi:MAG: hypothetical protein ACK4RK_18785 [Gemmataceae bacterium]